MYTVRFYDNPEPGHDTFLKCDTYDAAENTIKKALVAHGRRFIQDGRYTFREAFGQPAIAEIRPGEMTHLARRPIAMSVASNGILYRIVADGEYTVEITQLDPNQFAMVIVPTGVSGALITEESISGSLIEAIWDAEDTITELKAIPEVEPLTEGQIGILKYMAAEPYRHLWVPSKGNLRLDEQDYLWWFDRAGIVISGTEDVTRDDLNALDFQKFVEWRKPNPDNLGWKPGYYITGKGIEYLKGLGQ